MAAKIADFDNDGNWNLKKTLISGRINTYLH